MTGRRGAAWALVLAVGAVTAGCQPEPSVSTPPVGGQRLLPAAESATSVVVGRIGAVDRIDQHGRAASLDVVRVVRGEVAEGASLRIAWEELAKSRPQRFQPGDLILVGLDPLPSGSLWDQRFPGARASGEVAAVAAAGEAYLCHPTDTDADLLATYLTLPVGKRQETPGMTALARMAATASPGPAASALARLESLGDITSGLDAEALRWLEQAMLDIERPLSLRRELVRIAADRKVAGLRPAIDRLAGAGSDLRAEALTAVAVFEGGFEQQRVDELLASSAPELRAVGARFARSPASRPRLAQLVADDASSVVRAAAATSLMAVAGLDGFKEVVPALADADPAVRLAAVEAVSRLGDAAVAPLADLVRDGTLEQATGAVLALDQIGGAGKPVLIEAATQHSDERVRDLAQLALGQMPGHEH